MLGRLLAKVMVIVRVRTFEMYMLKKDVDERYFYAANTFALQIFLFLNQAEIW